MRVTLQLDPATCLTTPPHPPLSPSGYTCPVPSIPRLAPTIVIHAGTTTYYRGACAALHLTVGQRGPTVASLLRFSLYLMLPPRADVCCLDFLSPRLAAHHCCRRTTAGKSTAPPFPELTGLVRFSSVKTSMRSQHLHCTIHLHDSIPCTSSTRQLPWPLPEATVGQACGACATSGMHSTATCSKGYCKEHPSSR